MFKVTLLCLVLAVSVSAEDKKDINTPLTNSDKAKIVAKDVFSFYGLVSVAAAAGIDQWTDEPREWQLGAEGFGMRFGSRFGRLLLRDTIQLGFDSVLHTDPRYDRCECAGFLLRSRHALRRTLVARRDGGGEMLNISKIGGAFGTSAIAIQWYPDRYHDAAHAFGYGAEDLGFSAGFNMVHEFWPDIRRKLFHR
jgi:hypothetical protein